MDLLKILDQVASAGCAFRSLTEPVDTSTPMGIFMLRVLGAVAQLERSMIRERSIAGQVAAINRGVKIGRPKSLSDEQEEKVLVMWQGGHSMKALSRHFGVHMTAIRRVIYRITNPDHPWLQPKRPVIGKYLE
jgi:DNA invertase Pin-like site-specific DNA recombinase